jgi:hypothetical protein
MLCAAQGTLLRNLCAGNLSSRGVRLVLDEFVLPIASQALDQPRLLLLVLPTYC